MPELHRYRRAAVTLSEVASDDVIALLGEQPVALLTGRSAFRVLAGADVAADSGLHDIYDARVFGAGGELRWQQEIGEPAVAALVLRDLPATIPGGWEAHERPLRWAGEIEQRYLLWGRVTETTGEAHVMHEARIGAFAIPAVAVAARLGDELQLVSYELLGHEADDPNTRVVEELLSHLDAGAFTWPRESG